VAEPIPSARAIELASRFDAEPNAFIAYIESLTPSQWLTVVAEEERTVAALAHHVAWAFDFEVEAFEVMAGGSAPTPVTSAQLAEANAANGDEYAELQREEAVALLRRNAATAGAFVAKLSDEELARSGRYLDHVPAMTIDNWIRRVLVGHIGMHLRSIRKALGHDG
jgi:hypothetical protein